MPFSFLNGLSAMGQAVSQFAGQAGLEYQKADLARQQLQLADSLATTRETGLETLRQTGAAALQGGRQEFEAGQGALTRSANAALENTRQGGENLRSQNTIAANLALENLREGGATGRTQLQITATASEGEKQRAAELYRAQITANAPTPEIREVQAYTGGAKPGTPEYQKGARELALIKLGIDPSLYTTSPPPSGSGTTSPPPSDSGTTNASPGGTGGGGVGGVTGVTGSPTDVSPSALPGPRVGKPVPLDTPVPPVTPPAAGNGASYTPLEPGLDHGAPPGGYNESVLAGKPAWLVARVHAMNEGRAKPPSDRSTMDAKSPEFVEQMLLSQYNPNFDETLYPVRLKTRESLTSGPIGAGITAANTVLQHASEFSANAAALNNGRIPAFNWIANTVLDATGSDRPLSLQETVSALAAEARKVYAGAGGGTQSDLDAWEKNFPVNGSPGQQNKAMTELATLLHGRLEAVASQVNGGMQTKYGPLDLLNSAARKSYERLVGGAHDEGRGNAPQTAQGQGNATRAVDPIAAAQDAIARGASRDKVIERLRQNGVDPSRLFASPPSAEAPMIGQD